MKILHSNRLSLGLLGERSLVVLLMPPFAAGLKTPINARGVGDATNLITCKKML